MFAKMVSNMMIKPGKSPVFGHPKELGLAHEDVEFQASDGVTLRGWLIRGGADRVIVQSHFGVQCSRSRLHASGQRPDQDVEEGYFLFTSSETLC